jgi:glycerol-3-phosphate dehydrogenase subunit B
MHRDADIAVIGGGIAGAAAALCVASAGAHAVLIRAGPGVTAMAAGNWRGDLAAPLGRALHDAGLPHVRCDAPLPHPAGDHRPAGFAPAAHAAARVDDDTLVCGIAGLGGFHAGALARLWSAGDRPPPAVTLELPRTPSTGWSPVALAAALDVDAAPLAATLRDALRDVAVARVILPAVLGLERTGTVRDALRSATGIDVAEALGAPPSVPGWRLAQALDRALHAAGVEVISGRAARAHDHIAVVPVARESAPSAMAVPHPDAHLSPGGRSPAGASTRRSRGHESDALVRAVQVVAHGEPPATVLVSARAFVLATGKYAGGGIAGDGVFRETSLGIPVWLEHLGQSFDAPDPLPLTNMQRSAPQPILTAGVRTDDAGRPIGRDGRVIFHDVFVAGSVRAGVTAADLDLGAAAGDGWHAGQAALEAAS